MKKACAVFLKIIMIVCLTVAASKAQSKKQIVKADSVMTKVLKAKYIHADTVKTKILKKNRLDYVLSKPVHFDFGKKKLYKLPDIDEGEFYHIQIDDINMNLYTITHQSEDSIITSNVTFPTFDMPGLETLGGLFEKLPKASLQIVNNSKNLKGLSNEDKGQLPDITQTLNRYVTELDSKKIKIQKLAQEIDTLMLDVRTMALSNLVERDKTWQEELKGELDFKTFFEKSEDFRNKLYVLLTKLKQKRNRYLDFYEDNKEIISKNSELRKTDVNIKGAFTAAINHLDKTFQAINADKVSEWITTIIHLDNNNTRSYTSLPIQLKGDFTDLSIDIKPKDEKFGLPSFRTEISFPYPPKWYTGAGISLYYAFKFQNEAYSISATRLDSVTTEYSIVDEEFSSREVGIASLLHFGGNPIEGWNKFGLNISLGPSVSTGNSLKPRLATGLGISFGKRSKIMVNYLFMVGQVEKLSNNYNVDESVTTHPDEVPNKVTVSQLDWSHALSIGYTHIF